MHLHVFIVVECSENGKWDFDDIYFSRSFFKSRVLRGEIADSNELDYTSLTFHLLKKSATGVSHLQTLEDKQIQKSSFFNNIKDESNGINRSTDIKERIQTSASRHAYGSHSQNY